MPAYRHAPAAEELLAQSARENQGRGQAAAEMAAAPHILKPVVPDMGGIIGMSRPGQDL